VEVLSLSRLVDRAPSRAEALLGSRPEERGSAFADLNAALHTDGAVVLVAPGAVLADPIHLCYLSSGHRDGPVASHPRSLVVAGEGSEASVVESYAGPDGHDYLTNSVTEIRVEDGASFRHYRLQREGQDAFHVARQVVRLGRRARFRAHSFSFGARLARLDVDAVLLGEGGECSLEGLFFAAGERHADVHTRVDHAAPHSTSRELFKGILDGKGRGVFHGLVLVRPGAQKTDAIQSNRNLLLSREALVSSTPQLEILADDVKCKHGSTTGQLDPMALFYLRSRGIGEKEARSLLSRAFAAELVGRIDEPSFRAVVDGELDARLGGGMGGAEAGA
jgi:Fe-S cluster assembly protein SufD